ncbi:PEP-CTERM sorting domain-containing protein [Anabaena subtropica]|uniref:PEP-CTERM sorting domain-containing protein n=1 Tax=Anabaena subtropica FACHB-260 TaxID=2692884 RepID=A0ABR8CVI3_9NOST|nr:PEP-CTERM sorting domain-containing protein [Anabaena subtropica]MBD2347049.1 PEP-CTERM sorting domain-containing protein [Anabaena subtropica FACHB-260]
MQRKFSYISASALLVTGIACTAIAAPAQATVSCSVGNITFGGISATACQGPFSGNDTGSGNPLETQLDGGLFSSVVGSNVDWSLLGKSDDPNQSLITAGSSSNGTLTLGGQLSDWLGKTFVISLKASNSYSAYLFQNFQGTSLQAIYNTIGVSQNGQGKAQGLSHASLFVANLPQTPPPTSVPEPASLIGLGLVATGMFKIRRHRSI